MNSKYSYSRSYLQWMVNGPELKPIQNLEFYISEVNDSVKETARAMV